MKTLSPAPAPNKMDHCSAKNTMTQASPRRDDVTSVYTVGAERSLAVLAVTRVLPPVAPDHKLIYATVQQLKQTIK